MSGNDDGPECEVCQESSAFKSKRTVEESRRALEVFRALASPSYILQEAGDDPLLEVFALSKLMIVLAAEDKPHKVRTKFILFKHFSSNNNYSFPKILIQCTCIIHHNLSKTS